MKWEKGGGEKAERKVKKKKINLVPELLPWMATSLPEAPLSLI